jgi:hypothetical protein
MSRPTDREGEEKIMVDAMAGHKCWNMVSKHDDLE